MLQTATLFSREALGLEATIEMVEKDLPGALWAVWRCGCGSPEGVYASRICSLDFDPNTKAGWCVHAHGKDLPAALAGSYGLAMLQ
jgi:hypothetical protein